MNRRDRTRDEKVYECYLPLVLASHEAKDLSHVEHEMNMRGNTDANQFGGIDKLCIKRHVRNEVPEGAIQDAQMEQAAIMNRCARSARLYSCRKR